MNRLMWPVITFSLSRMRFSFICSTEVLKKLMTSFGNTVILSASYTGIRNGKSTRGERKEKPWWKYKVYQERLCLSWHSEHQKLVGPQSSLPLFLGSRPPAGKGHWHRGDSNGACWKVSGLSSLTFHPWPVGSMSFWIDRASVQLSRKNFQDRRDGSVDKVLALQMWGSVFTSQNLY